MKKLLILLGIILFIPLFVSAETITYNVCKNGCDYDNIDDVFISFWSRPENFCEVSGRYAYCGDLVINFLDDGPYDLTTYRSSMISSGAVFNKFEMNGPEGRETTINVSESTSIAVIANQAVINNLNINNGGLSLPLGYNLKDGNLSLESGNLTINNTKADYLSLWNGCSKGKITNIDFKRIQVMNMCNDLTIYNSKIHDIVSFGIEGANTTTNIYDSDFETFIYMKPNLNDEETSISLENVKGIVDLGDMANTYIHFNKTLNLNIGSKINLNEIFPYKTPNSNIIWSIDNDIGFINNGILNIVKSGSAIVNAQTDNGHVLYQIKALVPSSGVIEKKEQKDNNYAQADFSSSDLNIVIPLTNEEQSLKNSGKNVDIFLEVKDASETVEKEEKELIEEKLSSNEEIGTYLDVSLFKQVEGEEASKIEKTNGNISVSLTVPENLINKDNKIKRTYYILRLHDGVVDKLDTNFDGKVLTFETDRFSTYTLTYKDEVISGVNNPKTGDNIIIFIIILSTCLATIIMIKKYMYN